MAISALQGGWTPLMMAAKNGHGEIVQMLLKEEESVTRGNAPKVRFRVPGQVHDLSAVVFIAHSARHGLGDS